MLRKLCVRSRFSEEERETLLELPVDETRFVAGDVIVREGDALTRTCLLVDGYAACFKLLPDGSRQIASIHIAGDLIDLHSAVLKVADHGIAALGNVRVAYLPHSAVLEAADRSAGIARAFWRETLVDGSVSREWLLNIGQRHAYGRLAHLFCEMRLRMAAVGLCRDDGFPFPVTQAQLGDATALTPVHVNRMLQKLRADGLISTCGTEVRVEDWDRLADVGSFNPSYLYLPS